VTSILADDLLPRIAAGERDAVSACLDRYGPIVWSMARRFTRSDAEAEDATQDIFIAVWQNAGRFDRTASSETTFVTMIARRRLIDRLRREGRRISAETIDDAEPTVEGGQHVVETADEVAKATAAMKQLPGEQRRVLELSIYGGLSYSQIAERTGSPLGTVKTHARRGLIRLREMVFGPREDAGAMSDRP
jgi:RNA polymerase sigma-70 factor (ECF subfamily)